MKDTMLDDLKARRKRFRELCYRLRASVKAAPQGRLKVVTKKGRGGIPRYQYYVSQTSSVVHAKYLPKKEIAVAKALAQRDYEIALLAHKEKELSLLARIIRNWLPDNDDEIYDALAPGKRILVTPVAPTNTLYNASWLARKYEPNPHPNKPAFQTDSGYLVRSKSEVLIANQLWHAHIPFRYEYPVLLENGATVYPDFYILHPDSRREFIWEHLGRMDDAEYIAKNTRKISDYNQFLKMDGLRLIITMETKQMQLTQQEIVKIIQRLLAEGD